MPGLEPELLRAFIAVAERGGFTAACHALARSQSTVSMQVKRLEETIGAPLFTRTSHSVRLTPQGELMLGYGRRLLALADEAIGAVSGEISPTLLRVGCVEDWAIRILPSAIRALGSADSRMQFEVITGTSSALLSRLGTDFDLVLAMHPVGTSRGRVVSRQRLVWAVSPNGAHLASERPLSLALHPEGCLYRRWATHALDRVGIPWRAAFVSPGVGAVEAAVRERLALSVFPAGTMSSDLTSTLEDSGLPPLPDVEVSVHLADAAPLGATQICDHLAGLEISAAVA